jgi:hypothetical protein
MAGDEKYLTKNDLTLLMESYQNMFLMHKNILDQQSGMSDYLKQIIDTQNKLVTSQSTDYHELGKIADKLDIVAIQLQKTTDGLDATEDKLRDKIDDVKKDVKEHNDTFLKFIGNINNKMYLAYIGSGTVILGLIALFLKLN